MVLCHAKLGMICLNPAAVDNNGMLSLHSCVDATLDLFNIVTVAGLMAFIFLQTGAIVMM